MYRIATFAVDSDCIGSEIDVYKRSKKQAIKEYWDQVKDAFNGEQVICYKNDMMKDYPDIMPQLVVAKKTDWRYGEDRIHDNDKHRKQYLKYKYLGKIN
jgi:hypothetical protein